VTDGIHTRARADLAKEFITDSLVDCFISRRKEKKEQEKEKKRKKKLKKKLSISHIN
jgi:hypothetical protein